MAGAEADNSRRGWAELAAAAGPSALSSIAVPARLRVLVVGPHPDDFDANGVTLKHLRERDAQLRVLVAGGGSGVEDSYCGTSDLEVKEKIREREQRESCRFFGLPEESLVFLDMEQDQEAQPLDSPANRELLAAHIAEFEPEVLMLPHGNDSNEGHRAVCRMVTEAIRAAGPAPILLLSRDPKTISMRTDLYMPFKDDVAEWKAALLRFHDSQHQRNLNTRGHGFDERILAENRRTARELGLKEPYAEAFELRVTARG